MKLLTLTLILGIALQACGLPEFEQESGRIRIEFRDGSLKDYRLLAVRKTSLLVGTKDHPEVLPIASMSRVFAENNAKTVWAIAGGLLGFTGLIMIYDITNTNKGENPGQALIFGDKILWVWASILAGAAAGYFIADGEDEFDPSNHEHLRELREVAAYPHGEPPELYDVR